MGPRLPVGPRAICFSTVSFVHQCSGPNINWYSNKVENPW
jgi:hypothetical protein